MESEGAALMAEAEQLAQGPAVAVPEALNRICIRGVSAVHDSNGSGSSKRNACSEWQ